MARIAFHLKIRDGKREAYRDAHQNVPDTLEEAYRSSGAEIEAYSVFERNGHVFGYLEVEEPERIQQAMKSSDAQLEWDELMTQILTDDDIVWMDEVYRMK